MLSNQFLVKKINKKQNHNDVLPNFGENEPLSLKAHTHTKHKNEEEEKM